MLYSHNENLGSSQNKWIISSCSNMGKFQQYNIMWKGKCHHAILFTNTNKKEKYNRCFKKKM